jgi:hypothetical protein
MWLQSQQAVARPGRLAERLVAPNRLSKVNVILVGERTGSSANCATDGCARERSADQRAADKADASAYSTPTEGAVRFAAAAGAQNKQREGQEGDQGDQGSGFHGLYSEWRVRESEPCRHYRRQHLVIDMRILRPDSGLR